MTRSRTFTNEELTAYLDGEAEAGLDAEIAAALESDPQLREQLRRLQVDTAALRTSFDAMLTEAPPAPDWVAQPAAEPNSPRSRYQFAAIAAVAVTCLIGGWLAASLLNAPPPPSWQDFAAKYHALYVTDTLRNADTTAQTVNRGLARVAAALGRELDPSIVRRLDGLDYKRAQVLGFQGTPLIQVAYLSKSGAPVALCIIKTAAISKA